MFLGSWFLRLVFNFTFWLMRWKEFINIKLLWLIRFHRKIHFVIFNTTVLDILFTGTRTILHSNQQKIMFTWLLSVGCILLAFVDVLNISLICSKVLFNMGQDVKAKIDKKSEEKVQNGDSEKKVAF